MQLALINQLIKKIKNKVVERNQCKMDKEKFAFQLSIFWVSL